MRKLATLFCLTVFFFAQAAYGEGQADQGGGASRSTSQNPQSLLNDALSGMDTAINDADTELTPEDAYYLGRAVAANILAAYKPYTRNQELTRYLNRICKTIVINSPQPEIFNGCSVIILDSSEYNAFATPGGHIFVTRGLVEIVTSEDMLAAIIAHEYAHVLLGHGVSTVADMRLTDDLTATAARAGQVAARESQEAARAVLFSNSVTTLVDVLMKSGYSQAQEFEADTAAITLLAASGYNPGALVEALKVMQRTPYAQRGGFSATHPSLESRIANAEKMTGRYRITDNSSHRVRRFINK